MGLTMIPLRLLDRCDTKQNIEAAVIHILNERNIF